MATQRDTSSALSRIYVIGAEGGPYKVGRSKAPERRRAHVQIYSPDAMLLHYQHDVREPDAEAVETYAHTLLMSRRLRGEWFDADLPLVIQAVRLAAEGVGAGRLPPGPSIANGKRMARRSVQIPLTLDERRAMNWYAEQTTVSGWDYNPMVSGANRHDAVAALEAANDAVERVAGKTGVALLRLVAGEGRTISELPGSLGQYKLYKKRYRQALGVLTAVATG